MRILGVRYKLSDLLAFLIIMSPAVMVVISEL